MRTDGRVASVGALGQYLSLIKEDVESDVMASAQAMLRDSATTDETKAFIGYGVLKYHDRRAAYEQAADGAGGFLRDVSS